MPSYKRSTRLVIEKVINGTPLSDLQCDLWNIGKSPIAKPNCKSDARCEDVSGDCLRTSANGHPERELLSIGVPSGW
jgi:hypothetical protein